MKVDYSKPLGDISVESESELKANETLLKAQEKASSRLAKCGERTLCLLCRTELKDSSRFWHRLLIFVHCARCGHIQSLNVPPAGYPNDRSDGQSFAHVYPELDSEHYISRRKRIYEPKLDWILSCHRELGVTLEHMISAKWIELGSGAGYFLDALKEKGVKNFEGVETDPKLREISRQRLGQGVIQEGLDSLELRIRKCGNADFIVAFFVIEHIENAYEFFSGLSVLPKGTVFVFAVPTFGFSVALETQISNYSARCLEGMFHTQIYTDESIRWALKFASFECIAEWIFGQDASDLSRVLLSGLSGKYPASLFDQVRKSLSMIQDPLQSALDHARFSDARHIIAVKR